MKINVKSNSNNVKPVEDQEPRGITSKININSQTDSSIAKSEKQKADNAESRKIVRQQEEIDKLKNENQALKDEKCGDSDE